MPDCRKSHLIFQNFHLSPSTLGSGLRPLTGTPFPKFLDPPLVAYSALAARRLYDAISHIESRLLTFALSGNSYGLAVYTHMPNKAWRFEQLTATIAAT